jgi:hypothetical protein
MLHSMSEVEHPRCLARKTCKQNQRATPYACLKLQSMSLAELVIKRYHWALVVGLKEHVENGSASRFHAKEHTAGLNAPV